MKVKNLNKLARSIQAENDDTGAALGMWLDCTEVTKDKILQNTYQKGAAPTKQDILVEYGSQQIIGKKHTLTARDHNAPGFLLPRDGGPLA